VLSTSGGAPTAGELPQAFARLAAVYGGLYMLRRGMDRVVYDEAGVAVGVEAEGVTAKAKVVIGDPTYFPDLVRTTLLVRPWSNHMSPTCHTASSMKGWIWARACVSFPRRVFLSRMAGHPDVDSNNTELILTQPVTPKPTSSAKHLVLPPRSACGLGQGRAGVRAASVRTQGSGAGKGEDRALSPVCYHRPFPLPVRPSHCAGWECVCERRCGRRARLCAPSPSWTTRCPERTTPTRARLSSRSGRWVKPSVHALSTLRLR
jgi:hypothetical protein